MYILWILKSEMVVCWQEAPAQILQSFWISLLHFFFPEDRQAGNFKEAYFNVPGPECDIFPKICVDWRNNAESRCRKDCDENKFLQDSN